MPFQKGNTLGRLRKTHGMSRDVIYQRWNSMRNRCASNGAFHKRYADRGITVCAEWITSFINFYKWSIENGFREDLTLDRIDNNKGYSPDNCRWTTVKEQNRNRSTNHLVTYNGKTQCIGKWSEETGIRRDTLLYRLNHCKSIDDVFYPKNLRTSKELQKVGDA